MSYAPRAAALLAFAFTLLLPASPVEAQNYCQEFTDVLLNTTVSCVSSPSRDRAFEAETFFWGASEYLIFNRGNELEIDEIAGVYKTNPRGIVQSNFNFGTRGDSDYDLMAFDVCDGCRFGVLDHKTRGTVLYDLGAGTHPSFGAYEDYDILRIGSVVFKIGAQHYLLGTGLGGCNGSGVYAVDAVNDVELMACLSVDGLPITMRGGKVFHAPEGTFLYVSGGLLGDETHVFEATGTGHDVDVNHVASPAGMIAIADALAIDPHHEIAVSADYSGRVVTFWDLSNPADPTLIPSWTIAGTPAGMVSLRSANAYSPLMLWMAGVSWLNSTLTYRVDPETGPEAYDNEFWSDLNEPHNSFQQCVADRGGALSGDGSALYLSRYSLHQVFDIEECMGPVPAVADVGVGPLSVFPGSAVTLTDLTSGSYDRWALWVERNGALVYGSQTPSDDNPQTLQYTVPVDMAEDDTFSARITIESDELEPLTPSSTTAIAVDVTPQTSFTVTPQTVIVGDTVTLTASSEGSPSWHYWAMHPPQSAVFDAIGESTQFTLNEPGNWDFYLTAHYFHGASGAGDPDNDGRYEARASMINFTVEAVAASFTVSPAEPYDSQTITLDGSSSRGTISSYDWNVYGPTNRIDDGIAPTHYYGCGNTASCVIPPDTLEWGAYLIALEVTAPGGQTDETSAQLEIRNGSFQPTIEWTPAVPEIGEKVTFDILGVDVDLATATWNFGEQGCDGANSVQVCITDGLWEECKAYSFRFAQAGEKTVTVEVELENGDTITSEPHTVIVENGPPCVGTWTCGNAGYDNGVAGGAAYFDGGMAGDPEHLFAVKIELADFARPAGETEISGFCATDQLSSSGGPWPNEVFIYPDVGGQPNDEVVLGRGTIWTGQGNGQWEVELAAPVLLDGDFWIVNRGYGAWAGEDFNMEFDDASNVGRSYRSSSGIEGLSPTADGNYMLRAVLEQDDNLVFGFRSESGNLGAWSRVVPD
jgi:hypothetical protein